MGAVAVCVLPAGMLFGRQLGQSLDRERRALNRHIVGDARGCSRERPASVTCCSGAGAPGSVIGKSTCRGTRWDSTQR
jgi:hypothetical protein